MQPRTGPVQTILVSLLLPSVFLAAPAQAQNLGGGSSVSETESTSQEKGDSPTVELDIEKRGGTSLTQAKASLVVLPGTTESGGTKLSLLTVSESPRRAFDADTLSLVFPNGERETQDLNQIVDESEEGTAVRLHWIDLSDERLRRIADSEGLRLKSGGAVFDLSESSIPAQAQALLEAR